MDVIAPVIERVKAYAASVGWSKWRLATEAGLSKNALYGKIDNPEWCPRRDTLEALTSVVPEDFEL